MNGVIVRAKASYAYKIDTRAPDSWTNNRANNTLDEFWLFDDGSTLFACRAQTVANMPGGRPQDTIRAGEFGLKLWVERRDFWCEPHGIVNAFDLEGQLIAEDSTQPIAGNDGAPIDMNRTLCHDWQKLRPWPKGEDTSVAWSLSCVVLPTLQFSRLEKILVATGAKKGDVVPFVLREQQV